MTEQGEPRIRRSREETRQQLLAAARRRMLRRGRESPVDVRLSDVVHEEGMTTGAAYQIWGSQDEFRRDVAVYVASAFDWAGPKLIAEELDELLTANASRDERIRVIGRVYFEMFIANEEYFTMFQLLAVREPSAELGEALQRGYDIVHESFVVLFTALLAASAKRIRSPYTIDDAAIVVTALTEGLALRAWVQPDRIRGAIPHDGGDWHLYSTALLAVAEHYTEDIPDQQA